MNDDIKSMIKSRRDERYHGSAYSEDQITKAITDHKEELLPILNKIRNNEPLTDDERYLIFKITLHESGKIDRGLDEYRGPAYGDGVDYARRYLETGGDEADLNRDIGERAKDLNAKYDEIRSAHSKKLDSTFYYPKDDVRGAIRYAADSMGTEPRARAADSAKNEGMADYIGILPS